MASDSKTSSQTVRSLWQAYLPSIRLTQTEWFEMFEYGTLMQALEITAEQIKTGRKFEALDEQNVGKYVVAVALRLAKKRGVLKKTGKNRFVIHCEVSIEAAYQISDRDKQRFRSQLEQSGDCLLFKGATTTGSYGKFWINRRSVTAHFFAFFSEIGYLPASKAMGGVNGLQVAHSCLNRLCCNARHLRLTTKGVNLAERWYGFIDSLRDALNGDYGSMNGSAPSRYTKANPNACPEQYWVDPLAHASVGQTRINKERNDVAQSCIPSSTQGIPEHRPEHILGNPAYKMAWGVTGNDDIKI